MVASISARTAKEAAKKANPAIDRLTPTKSTPTLSMTFLGTQFPDIRPGNKTLLNWLKKGIFADLCHDLPPESVQPLVVRFVIRQACLHLILEDYTGYASSCR